MSLLSGVDERKFLQGEMEIYFKSIEVVQQVADSPIVFRGPGRAYLDKGQLRYEIYHQPIADEFSKHTQDSFSGQAGELVGKRGVYEFRGVDIRDGTWHSLSADTSSGSYSAGFSVVKGRIEVLTFTKELRGTQAQSCLLKFFDSDYFPTGHIAQRPEIKFSVDSAEFELRRNEASCDLSIRGGTLSKHYVDTARNVLNVISGVILERAVGQYVWGSELQEEFYSRHSNLNRERLPPPVRLSIGNESASVADIFVPLHTFFMKDEEGFYDSWFKINRAFQTGIQTMALHAAVAVEGVLNSYFKQLGRDSLFADMAAKAWLLIEELPLGERVLSYLKSNLGGVKNFKAKTALYKLTESGKISEGLDKRWIKLRSETAHALGSEVTREEMQRLVDLTFATLKLFYELMFVIAGYRGDCIDYETKGFPSIPTPRPMGLAPWHGVKWTFCGHLSDRRKAVWRK